MLTGLLTIRLLHLSKDVASRSSGEKNHIHVLNDIM